MIFREWLWEYYDLDLDYLDDKERAEYYERYCQSDYGLPI